jgi:hypothetical protein
MIRKVTFWEGVIAAGKAATLLLTTVVGSCMGCVALVESLQQRESARALEAVHIGDRLDRIFEPDGAFLTSAHKAGDARYLSFIGPGTSSPCFQFELNRSGKAQVLPDGQPPQTSGRAPASLRVPFSVPHLLAKGSERLAACDTAVVSRKLQQLDTCAFVVKYDAHMIITEKIRRPCTQH